MGDPDNWTSADKPTYQQLHKQTAVTTTDLDASLTKAWMFSQRDNPETEYFFDLTLGKRPMEELYDLRRDPDQLRNLAGDPNMRAILEELRQQIDELMLATGDPRLTDSFDYLPYSDPNKLPLTRRR